MALLADAHQSSQADALTITTMPTRTASRRSGQAATGHPLIDRAGVLDPQGSGRGPVISHGPRRENRTSPREAPGKQREYTEGAHLVEPFHHDIVKKGQWCLDPRYMSRYRIKI